MIPMIVLGELGLQLLVIIGSYLSKIFKRFKSKACDLIKCFDPTSPFVQRGCPVGMKDHCNTVLWEVRQEVAYACQEVVILLTADDTNHWTIQPDED